MIGIDSARTRPVNELFLMAIASGREEKESAGGGVIVA